MKTITLAWLSTTALAFGAQAADSASQRIEVHAAAPSRDALQDAVGRYRLADGRTLAVQRRARTLIAEFDDGAETALVALSATRFAAPDGRLALDFEAAPNGSVHGLRVTQALR
jgi:hypothetical protein